MAEDEATVGLSSRDRTCRTRPHNGQVQNGGSESSDGSDLFTISTDKTLAKPPDNPALNRWDTYSYARHQGGKRRVSELLGSLQPSGSMRHGDAQPCVSWMKSRVTAQPDLLATCRRVDTYTHRFDQKGECLIVTTSRETWYYCGCTRTPRWERPECTWIRRVSLGHAIRTTTATAEAFEFDGKKQLKQTWPVQRSSSTKSQRQLVSLVQVLLKTANTLGQATTSMGEDKLRKQLSAGHIGEDWMDSDAFCELQPIIGLISRYDRFDEWENVEHRNLIPAKSTLGRLILMNCEVVDEDLVRMDVGTDGKKTSKTMSNPHGVHERERTSHCTHSFLC